MSIISRNSLLGFCLLFFLISFLTACRQPQGEEAENPTEKPVPVKVVEIGSHDLLLTVESVGRVAANREVTLSTEVGGVVKDYFADVGDRVKTEQPLVSIDPLDYRLALREAQANLAAAQARLEAAAKAYERSKALLPQKAISLDAFDKYEAEYKSNEAALSQIKAMVDIAEAREKKTRISAPFPGIVARRLVEKGQTVGVGTPVMALVDLDAIRVRIHTAECDYVNVNRDDLVRVTVEAFPQKTFEGRIDRIGVKADERTNTFDVEILIDNPDLLLKPGLTARVRITTGVLPDTILIPQSTVLYREDRREVFVVGDGNTAELRPIQLGRTEGPLIQVLKGLKPGERLVVVGGQYLKPGDKIAISREEQTVVTP